MTRWEIIFALVLAFSICFAVALGAALFIE